MAGFRKSSRLMPRKRRIVWSLSLVGVVIAVGGMANAFASQKIAGTYNSVSHTYQNNVTSMTGSTPQEAGLNANLTFDWSAPGWSQSYMGTTTYYNPVLGLSSTVSASDARLAGSGTQLHNDFSGIFKTSAGDYVNTQTDEWGTTYASVGGQNGGSATSGNGGGEVNLDGTATGNGSAELNWFGSMLIDTFAGTLQLITQVFTAMHFTITNEILRSFMLSNHGTYVSTSNPPPAFGTANFSNIGDMHNQEVMTPFVTGFEWLASMLLLIFIYVSGVRISKASTNAIQRDRLKTEMVGMLGAGVFWLIGAHFATAVIQVGYSASYDLLHMKAVQSVANPLSGQAFAAGLGASPIVHLMNVVVGFISAIAAVVLAILVGFRGIFIDVWMALFPLAMVSYASENMKPFFKLWWTEWIYQNLIPVGQALIYAISCGLVGLFGPSAKVGMGVEDVFTSVTGVIAVFFVAGSLRKIVDAVASTFKASTVGISSSGGMIGAAAGMMVGDKVGAIATRAALKPTKMVMGKSFRGLDNQLSGMAAKTLDKHPELAASHIAGGGTTETFMQRYRQGNGADSLHYADGMGIPDATHHGSRVGGGNEQEFKTSRQPGAHAALFHSDTANAVKRTMSEGKNAVTHSNASLIARGMASNVKNFPIRHSAEMKEWRQQLRETSQANASQMRASNLNGVYHPATEKEPWNRYSGSSTNIDRYEGAMKELVPRLSKYTGMEEDKVQAELQRHFESGDSHSSLYEQAQKVEMKDKDKETLHENFEKAKAFYQPAQQDRQIIREVEEGKIPWKGAVDIGDGKGTIVRPKVPVSQSLREGAENMAIQLRSKKNRDSSGDE